ncbi:MAG: phosphotriesterase [Bacteroidota bacterium]
MTVRGPIEASNMGKSLIHEHILLDWIGANKTGYHRWENDSVIEQVRPYLKEAKKFGLTTFFECTPTYLGRDPLLLYKLSHATNLNFITNTGFYGARNNKYIPEFAFEASAEQIAKIWIGEFKKGIDDTDIRPGFIKIGVQGANGLSAMHKKLVRAAALTHLKTGLTIVSHTGIDNLALAQLEILKEIGVSPEAFVWAHAQRGTLEGHLKAARLGAWISLDNIRSGLSPTNKNKKNIQKYPRILSQLKNQDNIREYCNILLELKNKGILNHVLISHDAGWYTAGEPNGGAIRGYTDIFTHLIPMLEINGFDEQDIDMLLRENPQKAFSLQVRGL